MRYFLRLAYCGAGYHGWQRQPNVRSVQQALEEALATLLGYHTPLTGAGRTDAMVNAAEMYAHFDTREPVADESRLLRSLNHLAGKDIAVFGLLPVRPDAHARFDAVSRTYRYYVSHSRSPFTRGFEWFCPSKLDYEAMNDAASLLLETEDFTSFSKLHTDVKTNICHVTYAGWAPYADVFNTGDATGRYVFTITADRFLRNMVRAIVGTLIEVGRGKLTKDGFARIIAARNRCSAGESMPGTPLFLHKIEYSADIFLHPLNP